MMMKWMKAYAAARITAANRSDGWLREAAGCTETELLARLDAAPAGLTEEQAEAAREKYGPNALARPRRKRAPRRLLEAFADPFSLVLLLLAAVSACTDILLAPAGQRDFMTVGIITVMVAVSGVLRFVQETRSGNVAEQLTAMIHTTACIERDGVRQELPMEEMVVGDIVHLSAGDMVPADLRILSAKDLFISQAALTGESEPVEKTGAPAGAESAALPLTDAGCLAFQGSTVVSGSARAVAVAVGAGTMFGSIARTMGDKPPKTAFDKGIGGVTKLLIRFMAVMAPAVLLLNGFTKGSWMEALLFAISVAVGLTPEMLPMIVTTSLAKGALEMSRQKVIIKNLNAIQNLGSVDILCTDKTGTLTQDRVVLEMHMDIDGNPDDRVLRHAFLNSWFQTGLKNLIDLAVIEKQRQLGADAIAENYSKVDEVPFDFERRRMSVVVCEDERGGLRQGRQDPDGDQRRGGRDAGLLRLGRAGRQGPAPDRPGPPAGAGAGRPAERRGNAGDRGGAEEQPRSGGAVLGGGRVRDGADRIFGLSRPAQGVGAGRHPGAARLRRRGQGADRRQREGDQSHLRAGGPARRTDPAGRRHRRADRRRADRAGRGGLGLCQAVPGAESPGGAAAAGERPLRGLHGGRHQRRGRPAGRRRGHLGGHRRRRGQGVGLHRPAGQGPDGVGAGAAVGAQDLRQHDEVHQDDGGLQLRQYAVGAGGKRLSALPAHDRAAADPAEPDLRPDLHRYFLGQGGPRISPRPLPVGRRGHPALHALERAGQLGV